MSFRLPFVVFSDGERFPMLLDDTGVPHWYATLFITTQVRNASKAPNTMLASLSSIRMLFAWASSRSIDLEARFARGDLLGDSEIESLRTYSQSRLDSLSHAKDEVPRVAKRNEDARAAAGPPARRVSGGTHYIRMTYMAEYIEWLGIRLAERDARNVDAGTRSDIKSMAASLLMRRPQKASRSRLSARKGLIEEAQNRLLEIVRPGSESNPFQPEVQKRNELVVLLLYHLGLPPCARSILRCAWSFVLGHLPEGGARLPLRSVPVRRDCARLAPALG